MRTSGLMRPSKLRLPDSTDTSASPCSSAAAAIGRRQRARVADAGGAAEADDVEAELGQVGQQPGPVEVVDDHLRAGGQRRLHPRPAGQAPGRRLPGHQAGGHHHLRVRRVGAARDGGDGDVAVVERDLGLLVEAGGGVEADGHLLGAAGRARRVAARRARRRLGAGASGSRRARRGWRRAGRWPGTTGRRRRRSRCRSDTGVPRPGGRRRRAASRAATTAKRALASRSGTRSWGRAGPAIDGSTVPGRARASR